MIEDDDDKTLPLHDEAQARAKWRGGETVIGTGDAQGLPASEVDNAAGQDAAGQDKAASTPRVDLRPPD